MDNKSMIPYEEKPPVESKAAEEEKIRVFEQITNTSREKWTHTLLKYWKFASVTAAFAVIFFLIFVSNTDNKGYHSESDTDTEPDVTASVNLPEETQPDKAQPILMNESEMDISLEDYGSAGYSLSNISGTKILIVHSHNSEYVSKSINVEDAGKVISDILKSAGIGVIHCPNDHDSLGSIGAYERMRESVASIIDSEENIAVVIDIHDSDSGFPLTFTVGAGSGFGWEENLRLACAVYSQTENISGAVRVFPENLGQNTGLLMLNIGIGSSESDDAESREIIGALSRALIEILISEDSKEESSLIGMLSILLNEINFASRNSCFGDKLRYQIFIG